VACETIGWLGLPVRFFTFFTFFFQNPKKTWLFTFFWVASHVFSNTGLHMCESGPVYILLSLFTYLYVCVWLTMFYPYTVLMPNVICAIKNRALLVFDCFFNQPVIRAYFWTLGNLWSCFLRKVCAAGEGAPILMVFLYCVFNNHEPFDLLLYGLFCCD